MKVLIPLVAMFLLLGACSSGDSTDTLASEEGTTSSTAAPTTTDAPPEEEELDNPPEEDLIQEATWDGRDWLTLTAKYVFAKQSSNCTESLADVEKWMTEGNAFMISLMDIDEMYSSVSSIEYQGDGSEALVFTDLLDAAGIVIDFGDGSDGSNSWLVEDGAWKINNVDC
jgi:hypothetical protein